MKLYFDKWVLVGFFAAFSIIIGLGFYSYFNNQRFAETGRLVAHTNDVLLHIEKVLTHVMDMEGNQRGYIITRDSVFLSTLESASDSINTNVKMLFELTRDNIRQQDRLLTLDGLVKEKEAFVLSTVRAREQSFDASRELVMSMKGVKLTTQIRKYLETMQLEEKNLLTKRIIANDDNFRRFNFAFIVLLLVTALIMAIVFFTVNFNLTARTKAERALQKASDEVRDLYNHAPCGYHSLDASGDFVEINRTLLNWLGYSRSEVIGKKRFNDLITPNSEALFKEKFQQFKNEGSVANLEFDFIRKNGTIFPAILNSTAIVNGAGEYVKSRSTVFDISERKKAEGRILQLNSELEAFTYSVSHDLRAPLRSISGYARILEEDYVSKLDDEGRRVIGVIMRNAKRMGQLIDDLLDFSRLGRQELYRTEFDVDSLVRSVISEYGQHNGVKANVEIGTLIPCKADVSTMQQVWVNFISNAFKYSAKNPAPVVKIGSYREEGAVVYFISDNGVGFDMQYVGKLFGVFNRLHKIQEFEGTGVGLAIVHRIVTRHGGRVWAEGKLNEGATFYFSIPS